MNITRRMLARNSIVTLMITSMLLATVAVAPKAAALDPHTLKISMTASPQTVSSGGTVYFEGDVVGMNKLNTYYSVSEPYLQQSNDGGKTWPTDPNSNSVEGNAQLVVWPTLDKDNYPTTAHYKIQWTPAEMQPGEPGRGVTLRVAINGEYSYAEICGSSDGVTIHVTQAPTPEQQHPTITLDRVEVAKGSAIILTGKGFTPNTFVNILWNGALEFRSASPTNKNGEIVNTNKKGEIVNNWIWVKDTAVDGINKVQAEDSATLLKSNEITVTVNPVTHEQLIKNFDAIMAKYFDPTESKIEANPNSKSKNGPANNIMETFGLNPPGYACGAYQKRVLLFLNNIRFAPNPADRQIMDGFDYGPMYSGFTQSKIAGSFWYHAFVVMYPYGSDWKTTSIALDPWREQHATLYELTSNSKDWTQGSGYSDMIKSKWNDGFFYAGLDPLPNLLGNFKPDMGKYPVSGGTYYDPEGNAILTEDYGHFVDNLYESNIPKQIVVHCPVQLEIRDAEGHKLTTTADGQVSNEIPNGTMYAVSDDKGGFDWYGALPEGKLDVTITGTGEGSFELLTKTMDQPIYKYPTISISKGVSATIVLDDQSTPHPLRTPDGNEVYPVNVTAQATQSIYTNVTIPPGFGSKGTPGFEAPVALIALFGAALAFHLKRLQAR